MTNQELAARVRKHVKELNESVMELRSLKVDVALRVEDIYDKSYVKADMFRKEYL